MQNVCGIGHGFHQWLSSIDYLNLEFVRSTQKLSSKFMSIHMHGPTPTTIYIWLTSLQRILGPNTTPIRILWFRVPISAFTYLYFIDIHNIFNLIQCLLFDFLFSIFTSFLYFFIFLFFLFFFISLIRTLHSSILVIKLKIEGNAAHSIWVFEFAEFDLVVGAKFFRMIGKCLISYFTFDARNLCHVGTSRYTAHLFYACTMYTPTWEFVVPKKKKKNEEETLTRSKSCWVWF